MPREYGTDPYGILARGAPGGVRALSPFGNVSVGRVGMPIPDVSRAPGNTIGTGFGAGIKLPIGKSQKSSVSGRAKGGKVDGEPTGGKKRTKAKKYATGGSTASKRGDGCATKGKTKGRFV